MHSAAHRAKPDTADFLVVGAGVIGLTIALELCRRHPRAHVVVLDKERRPGAHASGRNSGVLHAGFYYGADSLKAALCREGQEAMIAWCERAGIRVRRCGKLVVARSEAEHAGLDELARRAAVAGVEVHMVDEARARALEPLARTVGRALHAPTSAAVDPGEVMAGLTRHALDEGVDVRFGTPFRLPSPIAAGYTINAAGLHADRVARGFGFSAHHAIVPFKGLYLHGGAAAPPLGMHVYPVPDLELPFLGVHFTVTASGRVKLGPTALPAPWREAYGGLEGFDAADALEVARHGLGLLRSPSFRRHALAEAPKLLRRVLVNRAQALVPSATVEQFERWGRPGIRAQLLDLRRRELVMDFYFEGDDRSLHVLNAVSPAFTSAFAFAARVLDEVERLTG